MKTREARTSFQKPERKQGRPNNFRLWNLSSRGNKSRVGAILLALGGIAISAKALRSNSVNTQTILVTQAVKPLAEGSVLTKNDISLVPYSTASPLLHKKLTSPFGIDVLGKILAVSIPAGGFITQSEVVNAASGNLPREISFAIPYSHADAGNLAHGDRIDVLATFGTGSTAVTDVIARSVIITSINLASQSLGSPSDPSITITVAAPDSMTTLAIANAASGATLWVDLANQATAPNDSGTYQIGFSG